MPARAPSNTSTDPFPWLTAEDLYFEVRSEHQLTTPSATITVEASLTTEAFYAHDLEVGREDDELLLEAVGRRAPGLGTTGGGRLVVARATCLSVAPVTPTYLEPVASELEDEDEEVFCTLFADDEDARALNQLAAPLEAGIKGRGPDFLFLRTVEVAPAWRGRRFGPLLGAYCAVRLAGNCRLVACYPGPLEAEDCTSEARQDAAQERLRRIWGRVGFRPWRDGVYVLDPADRQATRSLRDLFHAAGRCRMRVRR